MRVDSEKSEREVSYGKKGGKNTAGIEELPSGENQGKRGGGGTPIEKNFKGKI